MMIGIPVYSYGVGVAMAIPPTVIILTGSSIHTCYLRRVPELSAFTSARLAQAIKQHAWTAGDD